MRNPEIQSSLAELWQAQAMAEIIIKADVEDLDPVVIQTAVRAINKMLLNIVITLEEEL
ncbi:MAG: hypothetical protein MSQ14_03645 [[Pasteurella] aerogenes]|nr:hypothetical protein [[Pasteurella] aerogenes]